MFLCVSLSSGHCARTDTEPDVTNHLEVALYSMFLSQTTKSAALEGQVDDRISDYTDFLEISGLPQNNFVRSH